MDFSTFRSESLPLEVEKYKVFFLKLDHYLDLFEKSIFSPSTIPKNINLLLGKQIFVFTDARFDRKMLNDGHNTKEA